MTIFNRFLNLDTNKCFMMSDGLGQTAGLGTTFSGPTKRGESNGRDEMFYFLANQKFHTDMFWFDLEHSEDDRKDYVEFTDLINKFTTNIQRNYRSGSNYNSPSLTRWVLRSSEFLSEAIVPSLNSDSTIDQETLKEKMNTLFTKNYEGFDKKDLGRLIEIASKHISPTMIEKAKLYVAINKTNIVDPAIEREYSKDPLVRKIRELREKRKIDKNVSDEEVFSLYSEDLNIQSNERTAFTRVLNRLEKASIHTFTIENIKTELLSQLPYSKISDYLVAIKAKDEAIRGILEKIIPNENWWPFTHSESKRITEMIESSKEKIGNGLKYKPEEIAFDPSFVPVEASYSPTMKENVEFQLKACQKIEDEGIDNFPLAKFIYDHMKSFDSSNPESFNGSEQHLFRFFGSQFKNYTNYVNSLSEPEKSFSIQGFLDFLGSENNKIPGNTKGKAYEKLGEETLGKIGKMLYAQFGDINLNDSKNRDFFEANLRLMHNAAAYHCYSPENHDKRTYKPSMNDFYRAYLFPTPNSIEVIKNNMAIEIAGNSGTGAFEEFKSEYLISPLLDFIKAKQKKPMSMLDNQTVSSFKGIMSSQPEYTKSAQFSPLILPFGITFTSLTENQKSAVSSMISSAMGRQNAVVHSNGDTGSGKTFTKDVISLIINIGSMKLESVEKGSTVDIPGGNTTFRLVSTGDGKFDIKTIGESGTVVGTIDPSLKLKYRDQQSIEGIHQISISLLELSGLKPTDIKSLLTKKVMQSLTETKAGTFQGVANSLLEKTKPERLKNQYFILSADEFYQLEPSQQDAIREWQIENQSKFNVCLNCIGATPGIMFDKILETTGISSRPDRTTVKSNIESYIERVEKMGVTIGPAGEESSDPVKLKDRISEAISKVEIGKNILCLPDLAEKDITSLASNIKDKNQDIIPVFFNKGILYYIGDESTMPIENPDEIPAEIRGKKILLMFGADRYIGGDAKEFSRNVDKTLIVSEHELSLNRLKQAIGRNRIGEGAKESLYVDVPGITSKSDLTNKKNLRKSAVIEEWIDSVKEARYEMKIFLQSMFDNIDNEALNFLVNKYISIIKENKGDEKESASKFIHYLETEYAKKVKELSDVELGDVKCNFEESILQENRRIFSNIFKLFDVDTLRSSFQRIYGDDIEPIQTIIDVLSGEDRLETADLRLEVTYLENLKVNDEDYYLNRTEEIKGKISKLEKKIKKHNESFDSTSITDDKFKEIRPRELFYWVNVGLTKEDDAENFKAIHEVFSDMVKLGETDKKITSDAFWSVLKRQEEIERLRGGLKSVGKVLGMETNGDVTPESAVEEIKKLQQKIQELEEKVVDKDAEIKKLRQRVENAETQLEAEKRRTAELQEQLKEAKEQLTKAEQRITEEATKAGASADQLKKVQEALDKGNTDEVITALRAIKDLDPNNLEELINVYKNSISELEEAKRLLSDLSSENDRLKAEIGKLKNGLSFDGNRAMVSATLIGPKGDVPLFYHTTATEDTLFTALKQATLGYAGAENIFAQNPELANRVARQADENAKALQNEAQYGSVSVLSKHEDGKSVISRLQIGSHPPANSSTYTEIGLSDGRILRLRDAEPGKELDSSLRGIGINIFAVQENGTELAVPYDDELKKIFYLPPKHTVEIEYDRKIKNEETMRLEQARLADQYMRAEEARRLAGKGAPLVRA